jgi:hypothetical protein
MLHTLIIPTYSQTIFTSSTCSIVEKMTCVQGKGCQTIENKIVIRIDAERKIYSRCDSSGCDDFSAQFSVSGQFLNIALPANGMLAKVSIDGSSFTELATQGTSVLLSFGSCR